MPEPFILRALVAGVGVAIVAGLLGCFVIWRRMAYFGDSLAHAALAGIPLGILMKIGEDYGILLVASVFSILLLYIGGHSRLSSDVVLGIIAHSTLAIGIVAVSLIDFSVFNLHSVLFGDILTVGTADIARIYICAAVVIVVLVLKWDSFLLATINRDLANAEGINTFGINLLLVFLMAFVVSVSFQVVGVLLITSALIIPAAAARMIARSPESMAVFSCAVGMVSVIAGIYLSLNFDTPSGPSIILASTALFVLFFTASILFEKVFRKKRNIF